MAVGSHAVMTCLWWGKKRHLHCNYVQRSWSPGSLILLRATNERGGGGAPVSTVPLGPGLFFFLSLHDLPMSAWVLMGCTPDD